MCNDLMKKKNLKEFPWHHARQSTQNLDVLTDENIYNV